MAEYHIYSGMVRSGLTLLYFDSMSISSGGVANYTTVDSWGYMYIYYGGVANSTTVNGLGYMFISSGGFADSTTVNHGKMYISDGGVANNTILKDYGDMYISSGGVANGTTVASFGGMYISSGGVTNCTTINYYGSMHISSGGVANSTTVNHGCMYISSGGVANRTFVWGNMYISSGGVANSTTVSMGNIYISSGGMHKGSLQTTEYGLISACEGAIVDFSVSEWSPQSGYMINDLSKINGVPTYTITVKDDQEYGTYKLAQDAYISGSMTITNENGSSTAISVNGNFASLNKQDYLLTQDNGALLLTIGDFTSPDAPTISADITSVTNQKVTVFACFADDSVKNEYKIGNGSWQIYSGGVVFTSNGTVSFRASDRAGNVSDETVYTVSNIDKFAPDKPIVKADITSVTNQKVTVFAYFADDSVKNEYRVDNGAWQIYSSGVVFTSNGTVSFRASDEAGNVSDETVYTVSNIDKLAPDKPIVKANITFQTNQDITVSAYFCSDSAQCQYSLDNRNWYTYPSDGVVMHNNGTVYFRSIDAAGNISQVASYDVKNILRGEVEIFSSGTLVSVGKIITGAEIAAGRNDSMYISASGIASNTQVHSGGKVINEGVVSGLYASNGATLSGNGLWVLTSDTKIASGVAGQTRDQQFVSSRTFTGFSSFVVDSGFNWLVSSAFEMKETLISSGGKLMLDSGASATKTSNFGSLTLGNYVNVRSTINSGVINVNSGALLVLNENMAYGYENVYKGGRSWRTVNYGMQNIYSGGIATTATVLRGGTQNIYSGGLTSNTEVSSGGVQHIRGGRADMTQLLPGGRQFVSSNCLAWSTFVNRGSQHISSGGTANYTSVSHGSQYISVGGKASNTTLYGELKQYSSSITSSFNYTGDYVYWYNSGGSRVMVSKGWTDSVTSSTPIYWFGYTASQSVLSGAKANNTILSSGAIQTVSNGGSASKTTVGASAFQYVLSGGEIFDTVVTSGGIVTVEYDGYGENINVLSGGAIGVHGIVWDLAIDKDADFYFHMGEAVFGGYLDCYITPKSIDAISEIISFSDDLDTLYLRMDYDTDYKGSYTLSEMLPWGFDTEIIIGDFQGEYGKLTVNGNTLIRHGVEFKLTEKNNKLILTVSNDYVEPDFNSDLDGNGLADVILVHTKQGYSGAWLTTGDKSVIKWGNLSDIKDDVRLLGTGRLYGTENDGQDIFFADSKSVGAWNVVDGKVTGYKSVMSINSTSNVLGLGDFNGDGATDILLRSTNGDLGYFGTDGTGWHYLKGLGKEWSVAAVGDLDGNGTDDVIVRHDAGFTGAYMIDTNGKITWSNLDTLKSDMTIVGTGDFNGDGVDDVLLQNKSNGWVGAWLVEDGRVDSFIGICKNENAIEQIADFNGDGIDDLRIRAGSDIGVLYVNGADDTTWQYFQSVGKEWDTSFALLS